MTRAPLDHGCLRPRRQRILRRDADDGVRFLGCAIMALQAERRGRSMGWKASPNRVVLLATHSPPSENRNYRDIR